MMESRVTVTFFSSFWGKHFSQRREVAKTRESWYLASATHLVSVDFLRQLQGLVSD
jgi:hypothetical protein